MRETEQKLVYCVLLKIFQIYSQKKKKWLYLKLLRGWMVYLYEQKNLSKFSVFCGMAERASFFSNEGCCCLFGFLFCFVGVFCLFFRWKDVTASRMTVCYLIPACVTDSFVRHWVAVVGEKLLCDIHTWVEAGTSMVPTALWKDGSPFLSFFFFFLSTRVGFFCLVFFCGFVFLFFFWVINVLCCTLFLKSLLPWGKRTGWLGIKH